MSASAQCMAALERANEVRLARAQVKREVRAGTLSISEAMDRECCQTMALFELLGAQRRWGPARIARALRTAELVARIRVSQSRPVGRLTARERAGILAAL